MVSETLFDGEMVKCSSFMYLQPTGNLFSFRLVPHYVTQEAVEFVIFLLQPYILPRACHIQHSTSNLD